MNRRRFVTIVFAGVPLVLASRNFGFAGQASPDTDGEFQSVATLITAEKVLEAMYGNIRESSLFTEPLTVVFNSYKFLTKPDSEQAFPDLSTYMNDQLFDLKNGASEPGDTVSVDEVSVGRLGDERLGLRVQDKVETTWTAVRVGTEILTALTIGLAPDQINWVSEYLEGFLADMDSAERPLIPELSDMPVGWEAGWEITDVTHRAHRSEATPEATL